MREQFTALVSKASKQFLNDQVNERLKKALGRPRLSRKMTTQLRPPASPARRLAEADLAEADGLETTLEEIEGYQIVRAIVCSEVKPARVVQRDARSYFAVLLDDNNRKPIARLHFNRDAEVHRDLRRQQGGDPGPISSLEEIYEHTEALRASVKSYL